MLELLNLRLDLLQTLGVLPDHIRRVRDIEYHLVKLLHAVKVLVQVLIYVLIAESINQIFCQQGIIEILRQQLI